MIRMMLETGYLVRPEQLSAAETRHQIGWYL